MFTAHHRATHLTWLPAVPTPRVCWFYRVCGYCRIAGYGYALPHTTCHAILPRGLFAHTHHRVPFLPHIYLPHLRLGCRFTTAVGLFTCRYTTVRGSTTYLGLVHHSCGSRFAVRYVCVYAVTDLPRLPRLGFVIQFFFTAFLHVLPVPLLPVLVTGYLCVPVTAFVWLPYVTVLPGSLLRGSAHWLGSRLRLVTHFAGCYTPLHGYLHAVTHVYLRYRFTFTVASLRFYRYAVPARHARLRLRLPHTLPFCLLQFPTPCVWTRFYRFPFTVGSGLTFYLGYAVAGYSSTRLFTVPVCGCYLTPYPVPQHFTALLRVPRTVGSYVRTPTRLYRAFQFWLLYCYGYYVGCRTLRLTLPHYWLRLHTLPHGFLFTTTHVTVHRFIPRAGFYHTYAVVVRLVATVVHLWLHTLLPLYTTRSHVTSRSLRLPSRFAFAFARLRLPLPAGCLRFRITRYGYSHGCYPFGYCRLRWFGCGCYVWFTFTVRTGYVYTRSYAFTFPLPPPPVTLRLHFTFTTHGLPVLVRSPTYPVWLRFAVTALPPAYTHRLPLRHHTAHHAPAVPWLLFPRTRGSGSAAAQFYRTQLLHTLGWFYIPHAARRFVYVLPLPFLRLVVHYRFTHCARAHTRLDVPGYGLRGSLPVAAFYGSHGLLRLPHAVHGYGCVTATFDFGS